VARRNILAYTENRLLDVQSVMLFTDLSGLFPKIGIFKCQFIYMCVLTICRTGAHGLNGRNMKRITEF
jgi:hypothetical protein